MSSVGFGSRFFDIMTFTAIALVNVNLLGMDPSDVLIPLLLFYGLVTGEIYWRGIQIHMLFTVDLLCFLSFYSLSNIAGQPVFNQLVQFFINVGIFFFSVLYARTARRAYLVLLALASGNILASIVSVSSIAGFWQPGPMFFDMIRGSRFLGLMGDPNILAIYGMITALWAFDAAISSKIPSIRSMLFLLLFTASLAQIAATISRSGIIALVLSLAVYCVIQMVRGGPVFGRMMKAFALVAASLCLCIYILLSLGYVDRLEARIQNVFNTENQDEQQRFDLFFTKRAINLAAANMLGVGTGRTEILYAIKEPVGMSPYQSASLHGQGAHNAYIQILSDNGWITFLCFVAALSYVFWENIKIATRRIHGAAHHDISNMVTSLLFGLAAMGMFQDLIYWKISWILFSLAFAQAFGRTKINQAAPWHFSKSVRFGDMAH